MTAPTPPSAQADNRRVDPAEWDDIDPTDLTDDALAAQVERWVETVQDAHRALAVAQERRAAVVAENVRRVQARLPLDDEGDCRACGHHPTQHAPGGCYEWINDANGDSERCDCEAAS